MERGRSLISRITVGISCAHNFPMRFGWAFWKATRSCPSPPPRSTKRGAEASLTASLRYSVDFKSIFGFTSSVDFRNGIECVLESRSCGEPGGIVIFRALGVLEGTFKGVRWVLEAGF